MAGKTKSQKLDFKFDWFVGKFRRNGYNMWKRSKTENAKRSIKFVIESLHFYFYFLFFIFIFIFFENLKVYKFDDKCDWCDKFLSYFGFLFKGGNVN